MNEDLRERPIGVFDSGMGGLTIMRALMARLPRESFVYLGDTARLHAIADARRRGRSGHRCL